MENVMNTLRDCGNKARDFLEENKKLVLAIAGAVAVVAAVCVAIKLFCRKK